MKIIDLAIDIVNEKKELKIAEEQAEVRAPFVFISDVSKRGFAF